MVWQVFVFDGKGTLKFGAKLGQCLAIGVRTWLSDCIPESDICSRYDLPSELVKACEKLATAGLSEG